jgi:hypothetical protein
MPKFDFPDRNTERDQMAYRNLMDSARFLDARKEAADRTDIAAERAANEMAFREARLGLAQDRLANTAQNQQAQMDWKEYAFNQQMAAKDAEKAAKEKDTAELLGTISKALDATSQYSLYDPDQRKQYFDAIKPFIPLGVLDKNDHLKKRHEQMMRLDEAFNQHMADEQQASSLGMVPKSISGGKTTYGTPVEHKDPLEARRIKYAEEIAGYEDMAKNDPDNYKKYRFMHEGAKAGLAKLEESAAKQKDEQAPTAQKAPVDDRISVISPDGKRGHIPRSQLQDAIKAGYKEQ